MPVENRILLCCARRDCDPDVLGALVDGGAGARRGVDWDALLAAARAHGLLPLLYERLAEVGGDRVPSDVMARLRGAYAANLLRNRRLAADLAEVVDALVQAGLEAIVLKGGALAPTVYQTPAQRPMVDLDLLMRSEEMERAGAVLASLGFQLSGSVPDRKVPFQQRIGGSLEWVRSAAGQMTRLDMQYDLLSWDWCRASFPIEYGALWAAVRPLDLDGTHAWQLSTEDTLIHLCLHPALHHGYASPFIGYVDIDRVITAAGGTLSWPRLVERAARFQLKTVVYWGLKCAQNLLGTPVPPEELNALQPGSLQLPILRRLAPLDGVSVWQGPDKPLRGIREFLLYAALLDRFWAVGGMVQGLVFPDDDWLAVRYDLKNRTQARLYRPVHLLRIARSFVRGLDRPLGESSLD